MLKDNLKQVVFWWITLSFFFFFSFSFFFSVTRKFFFFRVTAAGEEILERERRDWDDLKKGREEELRGADPEYYGDPIWVGREGQKEEEELCMLSGVLFRAHLHCAIRTYVRFHKACCFNHLEFTAKRKTYFILYCMPRFSKERSCLPSMEKNNLFIMTT